MNEKVDISENEANQSTLQTKQEDRMLRSNETMKNIIMNDSANNLSDRKNIYDSQNHSVNSKETFYYKKIGNTFALLSDSKGNPMIIIGPDWSMYAGLTIFIGIIMISYFLFLYPKSNTIIRFLGITIFICFNIFYSATALINPGYPNNNRTRKEGIPRELYRYCNKCEFYVNKHNAVYHCDSCNICIEGYDHHCPWVGKCIGRKNNCLFQLFLFSTIVIFCFFVYIFVSLTIK